MTNGALVRPASSRSFPWYDSIWLSKYLAAEAIVRNKRPERLQQFIDAFRVLRTPADFNVKVLDSPVDEAKLQEIRQTIGSLRPTDLELHEAARFGRFVVHDHPYFTALQDRLAPLVSEVVGEPVEPAYNFLSLYSAKGVCGVHMDSPEAKWTLDLCIDQSAPWPIHFSQVVPWPSTTADEWGADWAERIKQSPMHQFTTHSLRPGQAVVFSGSSQWHYRDPMPHVDHTAYCKLLFLHFIPEGAAELLQPRHWARLFDIDELAQPD